MNRVPAMLCLIAFSVPGISQIRAKTRRPVGTDETSAAFRKWLNEDVVYIVTDAERVAFKALNNGKDRESFVEQFWLRRDPTPDTIKNEFKDEHYRRIAFANEHYGTSIPGWKTDRGRIYILFGAPDKIDSSPSGSCGREACPVEDWQYRYIECLGSFVNIEFADLTRHGNYHLTDPSGDDAPFRFCVTGRHPGWPPDGIDGNSLPPPLGAGDEPFAVSQGYIPGAPASRDLHHYAELEAAIGRPAASQTLSLQSLVDYERLTGFSTRVGITIVLENIRVKRNPPETVELLGRISADGKVTATFVNSFEAQKAFHQSFVLPAGHYELDLVARNRASGKMGSRRVSLDVPRFDGEKLSCGNLTLTARRFTRAEKLEIYLPVYNFAPDTAEKPDGVTRYEILRKGSNRKVLAASENISEMPHASPSQTTIRKLIPLNPFAPGTYTLRVEVTDRLGGQTIQQQTIFTVL
jgi:GWxTD domain-containing protein